MANKPRINDLVVILPGISGSGRQKDGKDWWANSGSAGFRILKNLGKDLEQMHAALLGAVPALIDRLDQDSMLAQLQIRDRDAPVGPCTRALPIASLDAIADRDRSRCADVG